MSMKSKFRELLMMGAMAQTMMPPAREEGTSRRKRKYSQGEKARFPRSGKAPKDWHGKRTNRRKMQKASRKANRL